MTPKAQFRLYIAGQSPNSRLAIANLAALCATYLDGQCETEIVDVFEFPERALEEGVYLTPQLLVLYPPPVQSIIGNLSNTEVILRALNLTRDTS